MRAVVAPTAWWVREDGRTDRQSGKQSIRPCWLVKKHQGRNQSNQPVRMFWFHGSFSNLDPSTLSMLGLESFHCTVLWFGLVWIGRRLSTGGKRASLLPRGEKIARLVSVVLHSSGTYPALSHCRSVRVTNTPGKYSSFVLKYLYWIFAFCSSRVVDFDGNITRKILLILYGFSCYIFTNGIAIVERLSPYTEEVKLVPTVTIAFY